MKGWLRHSGIVTAVAAAAIVAGFASCSSENSGPSATKTVDAGAVPSSATATDMSDALPESPGAKSRILDLSSRFVRLPPKVAPDPFAAPGAPTPQLQKQRVLTPGVAEKFVAEGNHARAVLSEAAKKDVRKSATVSVPMRADESVRLVDDSSGLAIEFASKHIAHAAALELADGIALYPRAAHGDSDILVRVSAGAVEDFVVFDKKPSKLSLSYSVDVSAVPGLRLVGNMLEFLDASGTPRLRVTPPYVVDADGKMHRAELALSGCAADRNPAGPWGRPVTAPGASTCEVSVTWSSDGMTYPVIVDPIWSTTGDMGHERFKNAAMKLNNGKVLVAGGIDSADVTTSSELYDPSGGGTWSPTGDLLTARQQFRGVTLSTGNAVVAGGMGLSTSELYNVVGGTWTDKGAFSPSPYDPAPQFIAAISTGTYAVMISVDGTPRIFNASTETWSSGTSSGQSRQNALVVTMPGAKTVMRIGGEVYVSPSWTSLSTAEIYDPAGNAWQTVPAVAPMNIKRGQGTHGIALPSGKILVFGGYNQATSIWTTTAEVYDVTANTWTLTGSIPNTIYFNNMGLTEAVHGSGRVLFMGDYDNLIWDPGAGTNGLWSQVQTYSAIPQFYSLRSNANLVTLGSGKILVAPVSPNGNDGPTKLCKIFDLAANGEICTGNGECASRFCAEKSCPGCQGICCDTACDGLCQSCRASWKGTGNDGTCGFTAAGNSDTYGECTWTSNSTCGTDGQCDGAGACEKWSSTTICSYRGCLDVDTQNNQALCNGTGGPCTVTTTECAPFTCGFECTCPLGGPCDCGDKCRTFCNSDADCTTGNFCNIWETPYNQCQAKKGDGQPCYGNSGCTNGSCTDLDPFSRIGVCCENTCTGTCMSCKGTKTGSSDGLCKAILTDTDPDNDCTQAPTSTCGQNGTCNGVAVSGSAACKLWPSGTVCVQQSCSGTASQNNEQTCNGSGSCSLASSTTCQTGYACNTFSPVPPYPSYLGACQSTCLADSQCISTYYCDSNGITPGTCQLDLIRGQTCTKASMCPNNVNCVDGVCCDSACTGTCRSCLGNKTVGGVTGTCSDIKDDTNPDGDCTKDPAYPNSCQAPGLCNGAGACRTYAKVAVQCDPDQCSDSTYVQWSCNGAGTCKSTSTLCYPYKCDTGNNVCRVACSDNSHCVSGSFCSNGKCVGQLASGTACTDNSQCGSGFCANIGVGALQGTVSVGGTGGSGGSGGSGGTSGGSGGTGGAAGAAGAAGGGSGGSPTNDPGVCCDAACQGTCTGCKASIKGYGSDGVCEFVRNNTDPKGDCTPDSTNVCGLDGQCNGSGACRLAPQGTGCGQNSCQGNSLLGQSCNGQGDCINNQGGVDCAPYWCRDVGGTFKCTNPCSVDADCQDGYYCTNGTCLRKLALGNPSTVSAVCASGFAVDGVCCDTSCNAQCEACDVPGSEGICTPVQGTPHGSRPACTLTGQACGGSCDGVNASACKYPVAGTACGTPSCMNELAVSSQCDGQGACIQNPDKECAPYGCDIDGKCRSRCDTDTQCASGYTCDETTGRCLPAAVVAKCSDDRLSSVGQNGTQPCKPFLCVPASGTCAVSCAFTTDCAPDFVCEPSTKTCLPKPTSLPEESASCSCRAAGKPTNGQGLGALAALGLALFAVRRRRKTLS